MGLWPWTISQMITPKFWAIVRREGFLKTWTKGHKAGRHSHYIGSNNPAGYVKPVGEDEFGNRYYEDFDVSRKATNYMNEYESSEGMGKWGNIDKNNRRWVEYSDYFMTMWSNGDKVPPKWHGWLSHQYDDFPTRTGVQAFVNHQYLKPHTANLSNTPLNHVPQGAPQNLDRMRFITAQRDRSRAPWESPAAGEAVFAGKKVVAERKTPFIDDMATRD